MHSNLLKTLTAVCFLLASCFAHAFTAITGTTLQITQPSERPTFFFKVNPTGSLISYGTFTNETKTGTNFIISADGQKKWTVPGTYDPIFGHDNDLFISLSRNRHLDFFWTQDVLEQGVQAIPMYRETTMTGFYESVGILEKTTTTLKIRVFIERDNSQHGYRDYLFDKVNKTITPISSVRHACQNFRYKLPMISKNGSEIGALNVSTDTTVIFRILDDDTCEIVYDFRMKTGKLAFSWDSQKIAYHKYDKKNINLHNDYLGLPTSVSVADIYVFDRKSFVTTKITKNHDSNSLFPEFLQNGELVFIDHPHQKGNKASFVRIGLF